MFGYRMFGAMVVAFALAATQLVAAGRTGAVPAECTVTSDRSPQRAAPAAVGIDPAKLAEALAFAAGRNRFNIQIYRHNCLVGEGPTNAMTGRVPWNVWSITKSVVSLLAGIAWDRGRLDLAAAIGQYLPPNLGDAAHRAITVEHLLTESSGLQSAPAAEGLTALLSLDPNTAVQALAMPLAATPGTEFAYSQRAVDLLAYVVEAAVGEPLQNFAQRELFDPLGIARADYSWARDRAGHTYGHAHLMIPPDELAKLGLLLADDGRWGRRHVVSAEYLDRALRPSATNACYGYLFWLNRSCDGSTAKLPADLYSMSGMGIQDVFGLPSRDLVVVWTGAFGNVSRFGLLGLQTNTDELAHEFFRRLLPAVRDVPYADPGPYVEREPTGDDVAFDPAVLLGVFGIGPAADPACTVFACLVGSLAPSGN